jgi:glyoxylase-like metal-dependent hydrolase (beta-lactamase superfamily II)
MTTRRDARVETITSLPFEENSYVIHRRDSRDCLIVDPGFEPDKIVEYVDSVGLVPAAFLITHGHSDHIAGNEALKDRWPGCPIIIGAGDAPKLTDPRLNLSIAFGVSLLSPPADRVVREGDTVSLAGFHLHVAEIPGHSSGHVVYISTEDDPNLVFGGDVLFSGSIGRTDFSDGDWEALVAGIQRKLFTLPDDTIVYPGHGPMTTIGTEKESNPFVGRSAMYRR